MLFLGTHDHDGLGKQHDRHTEQSDDDEQLLQSTLARKHVVVAHLWVLARLEQHHVDESDQNGWRAVGTALDIVSRTVVDPLDEHQQHHVQEQEAHEDNLGDELADYAHAVTEISEKQIYEINKVCSY